MRAPRAKMVTFSAVAAGIVVLGAAVVTQKDRLLERWYLYRLERAEDTEARCRAILELMVLRSEPAAPRLCELCLGGEESSDVWPPDRLSSVRADLTPNFQDKAYLAFQEARFLRPHVLRIFTREEPSWRWIRALQILHTWQADPLESLEPIRSGLSRIDRELVTAQGERRDKLRYLQAYLQASLKQKLSPAESSKRG